MCHNTIYVSTSYYLCVLILLYVCSHPTICVLILYMCPHTVHVSSYYYTCVLILLNVCPHTTICVLILLCVCPHTTIHVSSYYYIHVLILLYTCPHTTIYVSSYYSMCPHTTVCPHSTVYVSSLSLILVVVHAWRTPWDQRLEPHVCWRMLCVQYMLRELLESNGSSRTHRFAIHKYRVLFVLSVDADAALQQMTVSRAHTLIKC